MLGFTPRPPYHWYPLDWGRVGPKSDLNDLENRNIVACLLRNATNNLRIPGLTLDLLDIRQAGITINYNTLNLTVTITQRNTAQ
jgi:hypothetical protein